jgi:hypothetical protein
VFFVLAKFTILRGWIFLGCGELAYLCGATFLRAKIDDFLIENIVWFCGG